jgi:hypothetical protein
LLPWSQKPSSGSYRGSLIVHILTTVLT